MSQTPDILTLIADVKEQVLYLQELGVETLDVNLSATGIGLMTVSRADVEESSKRDFRNAEIPSMKSQISNLKPEIKENRIERPPAGSRLSALPSLSSLVKRNVPAPGPDLIDRPAETHILENQTVPLSPALPEPIETVEQIRAEIGPDCMRCKLSMLGRSKVVNSTGNFDADLMFVGEAPGADEDEQGFPFVGRAGKLLTDIMMAIGFNRDNVFIGNINRCRPPANRAPEPDETIACKPFLKREIAVVRPRVIVVLGATAAHNLLETKVPIGKLRGQFHDYLGTKVMPTFHPAYLLRDPHKKREVWEDMKMVRDYLNKV